MQNILTIVNIISAVLLTGTVLLQNRGTSLSGALGGDSESFYLRRGADKVLYFATIVLGVIFVGSILAHFIIS